MSGAPSTRARPRLLVLTPDFPPSRGGIQALIGGLVGSLRRFDVRVVALDSPGAREYDAAGSVSVRRVRADARLGALRHVPLNVAALGEAGRFRPHVTLNAHIVTCPAALLVGRLGGAPSVVYLQANEIVDKPRASASALSHCTLSIAVSTYTSDLLRALGTAPRGLELIPPGVELPPPASAPRQPGVPTVLTISRIAASYKGHDVLLRALARVRERVPDVVWVVIGDGPLRAGLEADAHAAGLAGSVRFLGAVTDRERDEWLARADVFAMPSRLPGGGLAGEGFGIVFIEAAARGLPVVAGNVGGAVDAVADGESGLLVDPQDPEAVADAISSILLDPDLARRLGAAGAARAQTFAWPRIAARVEDAMLALLGHGQAGVVDAGADAASDDGAGAAGQ